MHAARRPSLRLSPLQWAIAVSVALHVVLLALHFGAPRAFDRAFENPPLSVVLVNPASPDAPQRPQALAQANLEGGGTARAGLAATPLPAAQRTQSGDSAQPAHQPSQQQAPRRQQVLSAQRSQIVTLQDALHGETASPRAQTELQQRRRELLQLIGTIQRRIELDNARPRRRFVGPSTRSVPYALYYDRMREKIERLGTADFPQRDGHKLYGRLIMAITVDSSGRVLRAEVVRGSGDALLDHMARAIVEAAQPFGGFTPAMLRDADQIVVVAGFDFTRDRGLSTELRAPDPPPQAPATR